LYTAEILKEYQNSRINFLPPHVYAIANEVHFLLLRHRKNQCVLIRYFIPLKIMTIKKKNKKE